MDKKAISLKKFAEQNDVTYITAHRHWMRGNIDGMQLPTGKILVYGWKKEAAKGKTDSAIAFIRVPKGHDPSALRAKIYDYAAKNKLSIEKEIVWEAFMFQNNPYLDELMAGSNRYIITSSLSDVFGSNYLFIERVFNEKEITTIVLKEPSNIPNLVYKMLQAASNIAKAAIGMHVYKKDIADANKSLLS
jgi:hypothetical protein